MRLILLTLALVSSALLTAGYAHAAGAAKAAQRQDADRYTCSWGAGTAARAQELKLAGVSLYAARQKIQAYSFDRSWKRMLAMRITEQTYDSHSRYKAEAVRQVFYQDCVNYKNRTAAR